MAKVKIIGKEDFKNDSHRTYIKYTLKILKQYKGKKLAQVTAYTPKSSSCGYFHEVGHVEIVSISRNDFHKLQLIKGDFPTEFSQEKLETALNQLTNN